MDKKLIHICEVCGKTEILTPEEAFNEGWDYPPRRALRNCETKRWQRSIVGVAEHSLPYWIAVPWMPVAS